MSSSGQANKRYRQTRCILRSQQILEVTMHFFMFESPIKHDYSVALLG